MVEQPMRQKKNSKEYKIFLDHPVRNKGTISFSNVEKHW